MNAKKVSKLKKIIKKGDLIYSIVLAICVIRKK